MTGEHPHAPGSIVEQEGSASHGAVRIDHSPGDRYLSACKSAWITIDPGDAFARWTARKQQNSEGEHEQDSNSETYSQDAPLIH